MVAYIADGPFQEIFHVHLHVFPGTVGDSFRIEAEWRERPREELDGSADMVRQGPRTVDK